MQFEYAAPRLNAFRFPVASSNVEPLPLPSTMMSCVIKRIRHGSGNFAGADNILTKQRRENTKGC